MIQAGLLRLEPHTGLEPLTFFINQTDQRDGRFADLGRKVDDVVEIRFGFGIKNIIGIERLKTRVLLCGRVG
ncbi:MAG TPA: hypothetical protein DIU10_10590 [Sulfitobacter sp.]|nr:hypothetical protein [Sulfitobacter sp.]HCQ58333.1 hypothetical protein [Sulfitobacter sp.]